MKHINTPRFSPQIHMKYIWKSEKNCLLCCFYIIIFKKRNCPFVQTIWVSPLMTYFTVLIYVIFFSADRNREANDLSETGDGVWESDRTTDSQQAWQTSNRKHIKLLCICRSMAIMFNHVRWHVLNDHFEYPELIWMIICITSICCW